MARDLTTGNILVTINGGTFRAGRQLDQQQWSFVTTLGTARISPRPQSVVVDTIVGLGPGDQLVTTFTAQLNASDLLLFFNNGPLTVTGSPIFNVNFFNGGALLGTFSDALSWTPSLVLAAAPARVRFAGQAAADFTSIDDGSISYRMVTTVSGGSYLGFNLANIVLYDALALQGDGSFTPEPGINVFSVQLNPHPAFFAGEVNLGGGVYYLQFQNANLFGYYNYQFFPVLLSLRSRPESFVDAGDGMGPEPTCTTSPVRTGSTQTPAQFPNLMTWPA